MFRSATLRLTLWYLAIIMAISLVFSGVVYHFATAELSRNLNRQTQRIYRDFPVFEDSPELRNRPDLTNSNHHILAELTYFNLLVLLVAGYASYLLARHTLDPIEDAHERQKRFTADVSHELRTPLTALKMESEVALLDDSLTKPQLRQVIASNIEEANKLDILINSLLRLTRLEADELQRTFRPIEVTDIVQAATKQVAQLAEDSHITIDVGKLSGTVSGDRDSLTQLLVILLDNALKYSHPNSAIEVAARAEGHAVQLSVRDHGLGIEPKALEHVFDRFYRADSARTNDEKGGFGLGLSIAQMIAEIHHGTITLKSRVKQGTTALVDLPAAKAASEQTKSV